MIIINRNAVPAFVTKDTSIIREILAPRNTGGVVQKQSLAEATLSPGAFTDPHFHPQTEELYYILQGTGHMRIESDTRAVGPGDGIAVPPGARHQITNTGAEGDLVFLCCCAPAYSDDDTVMAEW